jgi:hypothetical protein
MQANIDQWSAMLPNGKQNGSTVIHGFFPNRENPLRHYVIESFLMKY